MDKLFSCCWGPADDDPSFQAKPRRTVKSHHEVARFDPNFHQNQNQSGQDRSGRADGPGLPHEMRLPSSPRSSIDSHRSPRTTRSSRDELRDVEDLLFNWLNACKIPFDPAHTAATPLLNVVFASYASLWHKWRRSDAKLQGYKDDLTAVEQKLARLEQVDARRKAAEQEASRLQQTIYGYEDRLAFGQAETVKMVAAHANEVAILKADINQREEDLKQCAKQHQTSVNELTSIHQTNLNRQEQRHSAVIQQERQKVKQAEEDMRMSVDYFQALQDDELRNRFYKFGAEIESLSRQSPVHGFSQRAQALGINVRIPDMIPGSDHKLLVQSVMWAIIVDGIFRTPFQVFGAYGDHIYQTWITLFGHNPGLEWPEPQLLVEKWRYTTTDRMRRALSSSSCQFGQTQQIQTSFHNNISAVTAKLMSLFSSPTGSANDHGLSARLHDLLDLASTSAILISLERCRVRVFLPTALGAHFQRESELIKDVYPGNEQEMPYATAEFVVAPVLSKEGNSRGGKLEERTVLSKATVYFSLDSDGGVS